MGERFVPACRWATRVWAPSRGDDRERPPSKAASGSSLGAALAFLHMSVEPWEVRALARLATVLAIPPTAGVLVVAFVVFGGLPPTVLPIAVAIPLLVYATILGYPRGLAKRMRFVSLGETPEAVSYLAMSLAVRPSLEVAVAFAAEHAGGTFGAAMRRLLWGVHLRTRTRIEDAFTGLADEWGTWNEDLKRALYVIAHAVREGSREGIRRALDRARATVYDGARRRLQDYAASLRGPTSALFALGVLLPLIVGSMLPLLSLGTFSPTGLDVVTPSPPNPVPWIFLLDVAFPAVTFLFAHHVSARRPGLAASSGRGAKRPLVAIAAVPVPILLAVFVPIRFGAVLAIGGTVGLVGLAVHLATRDARTESLRMAELEKEFPDALFQLGSRLGEGRGLEDAFLAVAVGLERTEAGALFGRIARSLRIGGGTVEDALFGPRGALRDVPSRVVRATLRMAVDLAAKDPGTAGKAILEMSDHLRDLQGVARDLRAELRPTIDAMRATAIVFAPVVLGVTGALYTLLSEAFAGFASLPMPAATFHLALGVYLVLTTVGILHFATRIEMGGGWVALGASVARALPIGYGVYAATLVLASLAL